MNKLNFLRPDTENLNTYLYLGIFLIFAGTALMQTGRAIEIVSITMLTYLSISLSISVLMNWYNKKIAIKEK